MATVYLLTDGSYSDYSVYGVYSTREKAEEAREFYNYENDIEEYELDPPLPEVSAPKGQFAYQVIMTADGDYNRVERKSNASPQMGYDFMPYGNNMHIVFPVFARDEAHAVKIANERRMALKASDQLETDFYKWQRAISG